MNPVQNLLTVDDLSVAQILELFAHAKAFEERPRGFADLARGNIAASLFYEPSTRTRLSFESAMQRLGGGVITAADMRASSATKGESLADTVRVVSAYADLIVLRHPSEGAAELASHYAGVPVVNAGDGSHEHPTQTLCDLYTLWLEKGGEARGGLAGLDVVVAGDLRYSRTIHSFVYALARFGANLVCVPQPGLELPQYVVQRLRQEYGAAPVRADASALGTLAGESDVVYLTPQKPHQLSLFTDASGLKVGDVDAVYMTRSQTERHEHADERPYMQLGADQMSAGSLRRAVVMHPLPRRDEINEDLDADPRSRYFEQAARGVPIRMAILAYLLGRISLAAPADGRPPAETLKLPGDRNPCVNPTCVSHTERRHRELFCLLLSRDPLRAICGYCHQELPFEWVGSSATRAFHPRDAAAVRRLRPEQLVFLRTEDEARELGFEPAGT
ncbi:MAG: aspartate carbamoyltransferase catalytic subunit [Planctomycetota bacterium]